MVKIDGKKTDNNTKLFVLYSKFAYLKLFFYNYYFQDISMIVCKLQNVDLEILTCKSVN